MLHIEELQLRSMSVENIKELQEKLDKELVRRKNEKKEKLLDNLWEALNAIYDAGYTIDYYAESWEDPVRIYGNGDIELN